MEKDAPYWIDKLQLIGHAEGGYYREVYRSQAKVPAPHLPGATAQARNMATSIYFLLTKDQFSAFHRISSDELWHFYTGQSVLIYEIDPRGALCVHRLGPNPEQGEQWMAVVRGGNWFASRLAEGGSYALVGCTVSPGFEFSDFQLASREELTKRYPEHADLVASLTR
jgi:uncharacterized protein